MLEKYQDRMAVESDGKEIANADLGKLNGHVVIRITPNGYVKKTTDNPQVKSEDETEYRVTVRACMLRKASPEFDFMAKWNNDNPMPMRTMVGKKIKETRGMVYMELHGMGQPVIRCMRCGKELTNPISRHYGIGPECLSKLGIVADIEDVESIKEKLVETTWTGWIIKSWIVECEEV